MAEIPHGAVEHIGLACSVAQSCAKRLYECYVNAQVCANAYIGQWYSDDIANADYNAEASVNVHVNMCDSANTVPWYIDDNVYTLMWHVHASSGIT